MRRDTRGLSEPGLGLPRRGQAPHPEHGARWLAAAVALGLLLVAGWTVWSRRPTAGTAPEWQAIAPPAEMPMRTWRWLVFSAASGRDAHFAVAPSPDGDPARVEVLPAWSLQRAVPGYPADAIVVTVVARPVGTAVERRLAELGATLLGRIPTLAIVRIGADRGAPPAGLDQQHLRFLIRAEDERKGR